MPRKLVNSKLTNQKVNRPHRQARTKLKLKRASTRIKHRMTSATSIYCAIKRSRGIKSQQPSSQSSLCSQQRRRSFLVSHPCLKSERKKVKVGSHSILTRTQTTKMIFRRNRLFMTLKLACELVSDPKKPLRNHLESSTSNSS